MTTPEERTPTSAAESVPNPATSPSTSASNPITTFTEAFREAIGYTGPSSLYGKGLSDNVRRAINEGRVIGMNLSLVFEAMGVTDPDVIRKLDELSFEAVSYMMKRRGTRATVSKEERLDALRAYKEQNPRATYEEIKRDLPDYYAEMGKGNMSKDLREIRTGERSWPRRRKPARPPKETIKSPERLSVERYLESLPPDKRSDISVSEMARRLQIPKSTAFRHYREALKELAAQQQQLVEKVRQVIASESFVMQDLATEVDLSIPELRELIRKIREGQL